MADHSPGGGPDAPRRLGRRATPSWWPMSLEALADADSELAALQMGPGQHAERLDRALVELVPSSPAAICSNCWCRAGQPEWQARSQSRRAGQGLRPGGAGNAAHTPEVRPSGPSPWRLMGVRRRAPAGGEQACRVWSCTCARQLERHLLNRTAGPRRQSLAGPPCGHRAPSGQGHQRPHGGGLGPRVAWTPWWR